MKALWITLVLVFTGGIAGAQPWQRPQGKPTAPQSPIAPMPRAPTAPTGPFQVPTSPIAAPVTPPAAGSGSAMSAAGSAAEAPRADGSTTEHAKNNTLFAIKVIGGLCLLMALAYIGGHRKVVSFQERLGITGVITAGFPFIAMGVIAAHPSVGILNADVIGRLRPIMHFGLGWLGFIIGAQLDIRVLDRVPKGTAYLILVEALGPFAIAAAGCGAMMIAFGMDIQDPATWRDMILLGTAAAMTAPRAFRGFANRTWHEGRGVDVLLGQLDEMVGVIGLVFITAYFRADTAGSTWQLPDTAWVFVSLGLGVAIGVLIFAMIRVPVSNSEFLAVVLGGIAFASGLAGYLRLSPIAICFIAGVLVTNFPNEQRGSVFKILHHLERPVHLLFLMIAGAVWNVTDWRGWVLVPLFVAGRVLGKWSGVMAAKTAVGQFLPSGFADQRNWVTPLSGLSVALVISVQSLYADAGLPWIVTAVLGGSIVTEFLVSRTNTAEPTRYRAVSEPVMPTVPLDELHDLDDDSDVHQGPVYGDDPPRTPPAAGGH